MIEIRFHGRGGQGAVVASNMLADAAFREGKHVQAFPFFGVERRGAPVSSFTRINDTPIKIRSQVYTPDYVIVLDSTLIDITDVTSGLKKNGIIIINTDKKPSDFNLSFKVATIDATSIALDNKLGSKMAPIVNTSILGAFAKVSGIVSLESIILAIKESDISKKEDNIKAAEMAYQKTVM
ncbi:MAG TPA: pyruvate ferredoxin oxidoreductase subunit gamma [Methanofastidiosum sp.]|nr:pyruvate ferredoxin oxidoreductase subunit gamma [Methanofastidiosum sp.]HOC78249.1 pyruvate ferredoxin oxidoreductase subunit gamma [Methanofastidiosum sp.]HOG74351.1 pyruvate ferredoxin oxidoreductase subunit gamma [Methanofastidiosum sp.]HPA49241.1 pyruvate ferredoxin oxidoreductase subunit gamma [Methanofastidiosum sp.]HQK62997.1 pyruvate ferredoxin oxidoreductase subunit gamma [Methanofastidiosum sp.]